MSTMRISAFDLSVFREVKIRFRQLPEQDRASILSEFTGYSREKFKKMEPQAQGKALFCLLYSPVCESAVIRKVNQMFEHRGRDGEES